MKPPSIAERIRASRTADEQAVKARVARVGRDDGVQHGRDHGPGIRLRNVRSRRNEILREADVAVEDGPDPERPNSTVRRARRVDPLLALKRAGAIEDRHLDAAAAMRAYARQAKNKQLEADAAEVRFRAERRIGELMAAQRATVGLNGGGRPSIADIPTSLPAVRAAQKVHTLSRVHRRFRGSVVSSGDLPLLARCPAFRNNIVNM
jgi:hypothetical protein